LQTLSLRPALLSAAAAACALLFAAAAHAKTEEREVPPFTAVHIAGGLQATVEIGPRKALRLEASEQTLARIETTVEDGQLRVGFKRGNWSWGNWNSGDVRITVTTPELREVSASGGSQVRGALAANPKGDEFVVEVSGGGEAHLTGLDARRLDAQASGGATLDLAGRTDELRVELSGGAVLKGKALVTRDLRISGSGGAVATVQATGEARGSLSGGSQLHLKGGARSRVKTSGGSEVDGDE
jgi:hypothetical protein